MTPFIQNRSNTCIFNSKYIPKGTIFKLKGAINGAIIKETIFRVEGLSAAYSIPGLNIYNVTFADPNINSGQTYHYRQFSFFSKFEYQYVRDPLFELSVKN